MEISTKTSNSQFIQQLEKTESKLKDTHKQNYSEQLISPHNDPMVVEQQYSKTFSNRENIKRKMLRMSKIRKYLQKCKKKGFFCQKMDIYLKTAGTFRENRNKQVKSQEMTCLSYAVPQKEQFIKKRHAAEINYYWIQQMLKKEERDKFLDLIETETRFLLLRSDKIA